MPSISRWDYCAVKKLNTIAYLFPLGVVLVIYPVHVAKFFKSSFSEKQTNHIARSQETLTHHVEFPFIVLSPLSGGIQSYLSCT